jgi:hypothetical protein
MTGIREDIVAKNEREIDAEVKQTKATIRSKHTDRIARKIEKDGFARAHSQMMNSGPIGWIEAQAWIKASVRASRIGLI